MDPVGGHGLFAEVGVADILVVTHTHGDHMDANTLRAVVRESTVLVVLETVSDALDNSGVLEIGL